MKWISIEERQALREALAAAVWNKRPFGSYLRTALRDMSELLAPRTKQLSRVIQQAQNEPVGAA